MTTVEKNYEEWKEIRSRVDSIANAIFLIAGGALSLSISVILSNKGVGPISKEVATLASTAWYWLLASIIIFLVLKIYFVFLAFILQFQTAFVNSWIHWLNSAGWVIGILGFILFICGMSQMVRAAVRAVLT
jgi:hypothetical protein